MSGTKFWAQSGTSGAGSRARPRPPTVGDVYFSADVETDGPIPGPYSMLSFALVVAGTFDGRRFRRPESYDEHFYAQLAPISDEFEAEPLAVNGLDRDALVENGADPREAMRAAARWISARCGDQNPVLVAFAKVFEYEGGGA